MASNEAIKAVMSDYGKRGRGKSKARHKTAAYAGSQAWTTAARKRRKAKLALLAASEK